MFCKVCNIDKPLLDFAVRKDRKKIRFTCRVCKRIQQRNSYKKYKETNYFKYKCTRTKSRSQYLKVPFNLSINYLESIWTGVCPVFNIPLNMLTNRNDESAAELDRFIPEKGYIIGNVTFISRKANRLKNSASKIELKQLLNWMEKWK